PIFATVLTASPARGLAPVRTVCFGDCDDSTRLPVPASPDRRLDPAAYFPQPVRQVWKRHKALTYRRLQGEASEVSGAPAALMASTRRGQSRSVRKYS